MDEKTIDFDLRRANWRYRLTVGVIAAGCGAILAVALYVKPDNAGTGTHRQLNLPACGTLERTGYPCPTCGMTTAFAYTVRGRIDKALPVQPAGTTAALLCMAGLVLAGYAALSGRRLDRIVDYIMFNYITVLLITAAVIILAWIWLCLRVKLQI